MIIDDQTINQFKFDELLTQISLDAITIFLLPTYNFLYYFIYAFYQFIICSISIQNFVVLYYKEEIKILLQLYLILPSLNSSFFFASLKFDPQLNHIHYFSSSSYDIEKQSYQKQIANMEFLKDPRFVQYKDTTTMIKFFPQNSTDQTDQSQNIIYQQLLNSNFNQDEQECYEAQQMRHKNLRRSTMQITCQKFIINKASQRLKTINTLFEKKKLENGKDCEQNKLKKKKLSDLKKEIMKFSMFSNQIQKFQKGINRQKVKVGILKKYNTIIDFHYDRFQVNEERNRKQIIDHQKIIKLLRQDETNSSDTLVKTTSINRNKSQFLKVTQEDKQRSIDYSSNFRTSLHSNTQKSEITQQKISQYSTSVLCQKKISRIIQKHKKHNLNTSQSSKSTNDKNNSIHSSHKQNDIRKSILNIKRKNGIQLQKSKQNSRFYLQWRKSGSRRRGGIDQTANLSQNKRKNSRIRSESNESNEQIGCKQKILGKDAINRKSSHFQIIYSLFKQQNDQNNQSKNLSKKLSNSLNRPKTSQIGFRKSIFSPAPHVIYSTIYTNYA